jgi:hypothetical protein
MLFKLDDVKADIEKWIADFVEVPHPSLGGWAPCPYARKARLDRDFDVRLGLAPMHDLIQISRKGLEGKSVVIFAYDPKDTLYSELSYAVDVCNREFLLPNNLLSLEDHPDDPEVVNGVVMNNGTYALALVQSLSDLNEKAQLVARKGFYDTWPEDYLQALFKHRIDPRES